MTGRASNITHMAKVYLLIWKPEAELAHLRIKCAARNNTKDARLRERQFPSPRELESALRMAGVAEEESQAPVQVFTTGLPTFISISEETAKRLGVLEFTEV